MQGMSGVRIMTNSRREPDLESPHGQIQFESLLDSDEAAGLLKIHPKTLQKMARSGEVSGIRIGKLWRFRASELDRWLQSQVAPGGKTGHVG